MRALLLQLDLERAPVMRRHFAASQQDTIHVLAIDQLVSSTSQPSICSDSSQVILFYQVKLLNNTKSQLCSCTAQSI